MIEWMLLPLKRYADFNGRSRRMEYWCFTLMNVVVVAVLMSLMFAGGFSFAAIEDPSMMAAPGALFYVGAALVGLYWLAILVPSIAVTVRRLHDRDMSGWWYLGLIVGGMIPFVGFIASIALLVLMLLPGTPGPNRFGPDPKDPASAAVFA